MLAGGAVAALTGPWVVREARSSSGTLTTMLRSDYLPGPFRDAFERETGVRIVHIPSGANDEVLNRVVATGGRGVDLVGPSAHYVEPWREHDLLRPLDMDRVRTDALRGDLLRSAQGFAWDGVPRLVPYLWGTEGMAWRSDRWSPSRRQVSFGDLWDPAAKGLAMGRPYSLLSAIGRQLADTGVTPPFEDSYADADSMRAIWDRIMDFALERKGWMRHFWDDSASQVAGFLRNGVLIGQTWGGPILRLVRKGHPIAFQAPREGAFAWMDGLAIPRAATHVAAAYAFMDFVHRPRNAAFLSDATGYNPVVEGTADFLAEDHKRAFLAAYPGDALDRLWYWPPTPRWYLRLRSEYVDRFVAA